MTSIHIDNVLTRIELINYWLVNNQVISYNRLIFVGIVPLACNLSSFIILVLGGHKTIRIYDET